METATISMEKNMKFSKDVKSRTTIYPAKSLLGVVLKKMKSASHKDICVLVFTVTLSSKAKGFKQHKYESTNE